MRTYPLQWEQGKTAAFEVENAYIGLGTIVRLLEKVDQVSHVTNPDSRRRQSGARLEFCTEIAAT